MTSRTIDVHCEVCKTYIYSLPLYPSAEDWAEAEHARCEKHAEPEPIPYADSWIAL